MNEQQLADLFTEQIDRMLRGESPPAAPVKELQELTPLAQHLSQVSFQASPVAQAAFQGQLTSWFSSGGGGLSTTILGLPKVLLMAIGAALLTIGAGLGLMALVNSTNLTLTNPDDKLPVQDVTEQPALTTTPQPTEPPAVDTPETPESQTPDIQRDTLPPTSSSLGDTIPAATSSMGDTLPAIPSVTPKPPPTDEATSSPGVLDSGDTAGDEPGSGDTNESDLDSGDQDRGHGNDADGFDEDNPGKSSGVGSSSNPSDFGQGQGGSQEGGQGNGQGGSQGGGKGNGQGGGKGNGKDK
jgi:hypothetical protein